MDRHDDDDDDDEEEFQCLIISHKDRRCDGCGLPPNDGVVLKRCTRCQQAFYHNVTCQRQHYPHHKATCLGVSTTTTTTTTTRDPQYPHARNSHAGSAAAAPTEEKVSSSSSSSSMVRVEERPHRGKCLIATRNIKAHEVILPPSSSSSTNAGTFAPLVPPVLFAELRHTHCAVCFRKLSTTTATTTARSSSSTIVLCQEPRYPVAVCSVPCQTASQDWLPFEIQAIASSLRHQFARHPRVRILPSAVLTYRILLAVVAAGSNNNENNNNNDPKQSPYNGWTPPIHWHNDVLAMKAHAPTDPDASTHAQATLILVATWLEATSDTVLPRVVQMCGGGDGLETIVPQILQRLMCNAFTVTMASSSSITDTGTPTPSLGFGLYRSPAHSINHSCCPNAVQSFVVGTTTVGPELQFHAGVRPIDAGEEICISYTPLANSNNTNNNTTKERRAELQSTYHFVCQCPRCGLGEE